MTEREARKPSDFRVGQVVTMTGTIRAITDLTPDTHVRLTLDCDLAARAAQADAGAALAWPLALVLARYLYGEATWAGLDPEERNAIAEPYTGAAELYVPMVRAALALTAAEDRS